MSVTISVEEWRASLDSLDSPAKDALTIWGWAARLGRPRRAAAEWLRVGLERGWVERAVMTITELTGRERRVVGFRLADKPRKGGK